MYLTKLAYDPIMQTLDNSDEVLLGSLTQISQKRTSRSLSEVNSEVFDSLVGNPFLIPNYLEGFLHENLIFALRVRV
jgi:hypothetical protein